MSNLHIDENGSPQELLDADGVVRAIVVPKPYTASTFIEAHSETSDMAAFIVRAVNCHDELVDAIENLNDPSLDELLKRARGEK